MLNFVLDFIAKNPSTMNKKVIQCEITRILLDMPTGAPPAIK